MLYVSPTMGDSLGIQGFAAAVLGGFGSIPGAIVGGLGIGVIGSFAAQWFQGYSDLVTFVVFTVLVMIKPTGMFGERTVNRGDAFFFQAFRSPKLARAAGLAVLAVLAWLLPYRLNIYWISVADTAILFALLAVGMGLVIGIAGQVKKFSAAQIAFFGVGAYVTAILTTRDGYGFWTAAVSAVIATALTGIVVGTPALRVQSHYLGSSR